MDKPIPKEILDRIEWTTQDDSTRKIKSIAPHTPCEDCGELVEDRRVRMSVNRSKGYHPHIKYHCKVCDRYRNPTTGVYDMTFGEVLAHYYIPKRTKR